MIEADKIKELKEYYKNAILERTCDKGEAGLKEFEECDCCKTGYEQGCFAIDKAIEFTEEKYKVMLKDTCDDDTAIRRLALQILSKREVYGDSYYVPSIVDLVEEIINIKVGKHEK